ncbi:TonB-dependent receptor domain-containing protein [Mucilaginibacter defluvii]|uniref:TonB-dependent receptor n=1 Tax=Mucilaginibacter defluvii TaxID=1196019 RepID=A0ABP9FZ42_9SPHI
MKISTLLIILALVQVSAKSLSQQITLQETNAPLEKVTNLIKKQTGFVFFFTEQELKNERITVKVSNASLQNALKACFTRGDIEYKIIGNNIVLKRGNAAVSFQQAKVQPGWVSGKVTDAKNGETLVGVSITLIGRTIGTTSKTDGSYSISLESGTYTIQASFVGYKTLIHEQVIIKDGQLTALDFALQPGENALSEVVISGSFRTSPTYHTNERQIVELIQKAPTIVSAISNEQIIKSFDRSSAEVMRRFAGIILSDNRFIQVRGLDPRYSVTFLNGLPAPSAESDRRSFSYDMINSNVIDRIVSYKSQSPELYGELSGGLVNISTKHAVDKKQFDIQISSQYRPGSTGKNYYTYAGSAMDLLAFGANDRDLPKDLPPASLELATPIPDEFGRKIIRPNFDLQTKTARPDVRLVMTYLNRFNVGSQYLNSISLLSYTNANAQNTPTLIRSNSSSGTLPTYFQFQNFDQSVSLSAIQNFMYPVSKRVNIEWKNLFTQDADNAVSVSDGIVMGGNYAGRTIFDQYTQRSLYSSQLSTNILLNDAGTSFINAIAGYAYTNERIPGQRDFFYSNYLEAYRDGSSGKKPWELNPIDSTGYYDVVFFQGRNGTAGSNAGITRNAMRYYRTGEKAWSGTINYNTQLPAGIKLLAGGFMELRNRDNMSRVIGIRKTQPSLGDLEGKFYMPFERMSDWVNPDRIGNGLSMVDVNLAASGYNGNSKVFAGYTTLTIPLFNNKVMVYGGLRADYNRYTVENLKADGTPKARLNPITNTLDSINTKLNIDKLYWLPSLNVTWHVTDKLQIRGSYGKSINRPEFRESAELSYYDNRLDANIAGNSQLKFATLDNYDLRVEYYPAEGQQWTLGGYYKKITNAIERYSVAASNFESDALTFRNTPNSKVYGIEAEMRQSLRFIPVDFMRYFSVIANGSYLFTETVRRLSAEEPKYETASEKRPMQGATPFLINGGLYFDRSKSGTSVSLLCNITGQKLAFVGGTFNADRYELGRAVLDVSITQRLNKRITLRAGVQDLFNQPIQLGRDADGDNKYTKSGPVLTANGGQVQDYIEYRYRLGAYYSLGLNFKL